MNYVTGDIHGEYQKFLRMLKLINFKEEDTLYVIGDCIDRGNDGIKVLNHIMNAPNIELLLGNHEKMMMDFIESGSPHDMMAWFYNKGAVTCDNFNLLAKDEKIKLYEYIRNLPYYKIVDKYILCHAGIKVPENSSGMDVEAILKSQTAKDLLWIRETFYNNKAIDDYTVIFGHTPAANIDESTINEAGEFCAWHDNKYGDKICIDCCASYPFGRLCCIRLDDLQEFYV